MGGLTLGAPLAPHAVGWRDLVCVVPRWPRQVAAGVVNVSVVRGGDAMPSVTGAPLSIVVHAEWTGISGCNVSGNSSNASMPAEEDTGLRAVDEACTVTDFATGGSPLHVYGWGLDPAFHHELHFTDIPGNVLQVPLSTLNPQPSTLNPQPSTLNP